MTISTIWKRRAALVKSSTCHWKIVKYRINSPTLFSSYYQTIGDARTVQSATGELAYVAACALRERYIVDNVDDIEFLESVARLDDYITCPACLKLIASRYNKTADR